MKLGKDEIQKIFLAALLLGGVIYCYFTMLLGPLNRQEATANARIAELGPRLEEARKQIKRTQQLEQQAPESLAVLDSINSLIPEGAPIAWFPPKMAEFFKRQGVEKAAARLTNEEAEKDLAGYRRLIWTVDLPKVEFISLAIAIAGLENEEPLLEISNIQIESIPADVQFQHAMLSIGNVTKQ
jgi:hypothetical protein